MLLNQLQDELEALREQNLFRSLKAVEGQHGRLIAVNGRQVLNFASNNYLNLAEDPRLIKAMQEAAAVYGVGSGASRLIAGNNKVFDGLERDIAHLKGQEAALVFSSGYMANVGILSALANDKTLFIADKLNHASLIDGMILGRCDFKRYPHHDLEHLENILKASGAYQRRIIVTDSVFSMDGDVAPLKEIVALSRRYEADVMVDEAHGFGVLGDNGGGLTESLGLTQDITIQMGTLSKAAGCFGAYVAGSSILCDYLINKSRAFIYTTALPPALAVVARMAVGIIREDKEGRRDLLAKAAALRESLKVLGFNVGNSVTPIIPVILKDEAKALKASAQLLDQGIFVQAIRPPTVPINTARLRITVTAAHTQDDINVLINTLKKL